MLGFRDTGRYFKGKCTFQKCLCRGRGGDLLDSGHQAAGLDLLDSDHQAAGLDLLRSDHQAAGLDLLCSDHSTCILLFILD